MVFNRDRNPPQVCDYYDKLVAGQIPVLVTTLSDCIRLHPPLSELPRSSLPNLLHRARRDAQEEIARNSMSNNITINNGGSGGSPPHATANGSAQGNSNNNNNQNNNGNNGGAHPYGVGFSPSGQGHGIPAMFPPHPVMAVNLHGDITHMVRLRNPPILGRTPHIDIHLERTDKGYGRGWMQRATFYVPTAYEVTSISVEGGGSEIVVSTRRQIQRLRGPHSPGTSVAQLVADQTIHHTHFELPITVYPVTRGFQTFTKTGDKYVVDLPEHEINIDPAPPVVDGGSSNGSGGSPPRGLPPFNIGDSFDNTTPGGGTQYRQLPPRPSPNQPSGLPPTLPNPLPPTRQAGNGNADRRNEDDANQVPAGGGQQGGANGPADGQGGNQVPAGGGQQGGANGPADGQGGNQVPAGGGQTRGVRTAQQTVKEETKSRPAEANKGVRTAQQTVKEETKSRPSEANKRVRTAQLLTLPGHVTSAIPT